LKKYSIVAASNNNGTSSPNFTAAIGSGGGCCSGSMYEYDKETYVELLLFKPLTASFYEMNVSPFTNYIDENLAEQTMVKAIEYLKTSNSLCDNYNDNDNVGSSSISCRIDNPKTPNAIPSYLDLVPSVI
jgi:hypothetical protein